MNTDKTLPEDILKVEIEKYEKQFNYTGHVKSIAHHFYHLRNSEVEWLKLGKATAESYAGNLQAKIKQQAATIAELQADCATLKEERDHLKYVKDYKAEQQQQTIAELLEGLEKIVSPVKFMQIDAEKEGYHLDGMMAIQLSKDPSYLQEIAKQLLNKHKP